MKELDVVVWGATGITGKRVCQQLVERYQGRVKWALAGRSREKLTALRTELDSPDASKTVPVIVADVSDRASIDAMVQQTDVVIACAGPFELYSDIVVESCVAQGCHFLDVTGEVDWVKSVIQRFDEAAKQKGVKIVSFCGLDSVPADIGAFYLASYAQQRYGRGLTRVLGCYDIQNPAKRALSGGTVATAILNITKRQTRKKRGEKSIPFVPSPPGSKSVASVTPRAVKRGFRVRFQGEPDQYAPRWEKDFGFWTSPFLMQAVNKRVVQRSSALQSEPYGTGFTYAEAIQERGLLGAWARSLQLLLLVVVLVVPPLRSLLFRLGVLPHPGEGPSVEEEEKTSYRVNFYGTVEPDENSEVQIVKSCFSDNVGPYTSTARMVVECAMCQILDKSQLQEQNLPEGGALTPSTAFGDILVERLNAIGVKSEIL